MFQNVFFGSMQGMVAYFGVKLFLLIVAWFGKLGWSGFTPLALAVHLIMDYAIFLNLAPLIGAGVLGGLGGLTPQTQSTIGSGAATAVNGFIRFSMGVSFSVTLMILSLIPFDYMFQMGNFLFVALFLLAWGQYGLTFGGGAEWARKVSLGMMLLLSAIAVGVMMSPTIFQILTGHGPSYWNQNKEVTITDTEIENNAVEYNKAAIGRVLSAVRKNSIRNNKDLEGFIGKGFSKEDLEIYRGGKDLRDTLTIPGAVKNGVEKSRNWLSTSSWQEIAILAGIALFVLLFWRWWKHPPTRTGTSSGFSFPWKWVSGFLIAALLAGVVAIFVNRDVGNMAKSAITQGWAMAKGDKVTDITVNMEGKTEIPSPGPGTWRVSIKDDRMNVCKSPGDTGHFAAIISPEISTAKTSDPESLVSPGKKPFTIVFQTSKTPEAQGGEGITIGLDNKVSAWVNIPKKGCVLTNGKKEIKTTVVFEPL